MAWIYKLRVCLITSVAVILIVFAVAFSVLRAVLPHATGYVDEVERELSRQTGLPVTIGSIDADMDWFTPRLKLLDVVIKNKEGTAELFRLDEAIFALAYVDSVLHLSPRVGDISLVGTDLNIEHYADGRWVVQGLEIGGDGAGDSPDELIDFVENANFSLLDSDIFWRDHTSKAEPLRFIGVNVVIESFSDEHNLEIDFKPPQAYGQAFRLIAKVNGSIHGLRDASWEAYLEGTALNINRIIDRLKLEGVPEVKGMFDGRAWLTFEAHEVTAITADLSIDMFDLSAISAQGQWHADRIETKFNWQKYSKGWRLDVMDTLLAKEGIRWKEPAEAYVIHNEETGTSVSASYLRVQDLFGLADIFSDQAGISKLVDIERNIITGDIYNLSMHVPAGEEVSPDISLTFTDLNFVLPDNNIKVAGLDGIAAYKDEHAELELLTESVGIDFGKLFRHPISADLLQGRMILSRQEEGWRLESPDIYFLNMDIEANSRLDIHIPDKGSAFIDMQTDFRNAIGASVSRYLPVTVMPENTVNWLDKSIINGLVENGSFILHGDIGRFPYDSHDGVMEVLFGASDVTLKFLDDWPEINELAADVRFYNSSMSIENGSGKSYRGILKNVTASIPALDRAELHVEGEVRAPAEDVQQYIWNSDLDDVLGAAMKQFQASGDVLLALALDIPLSEKIEDHAVGVNGGLDFIGNELYFPIMHYTLDHINGHMSFTEKSLSASGVSAIFEDSPVQINVTTTDQSPVSETIFHMRGDLSVDRLLQKFNWVPAKWFNGSSDWDVAIHVPARVEDHSLRVEMQSALEGTEINISDALSKNRASVLLMELEIKMLGDSLQLQVNSDTVLSLFATRDDESDWDFIVDSEFIRGSGEFAEDFNTGSTVRLELERLDIPALFNSTDKGKEGMSFKPAMFPSLDITTKILQWNEFTFDSVKLKSEWNPHGMLVNTLEFSSPAMTVTGKGSWLSSWRYEHESTFNFSVSSNNLGHALATLGITNRLSRCEQVASLDLKWLAEPYNFSLADVSGRAHVELRDGEVKDVQPGAGGRLMGLFNVFKLGDRLLLDFGDVYREGFAFDSVIGDFEFENGNATTENIELKAASADVRMIGRIGLDRQDYNLEMQVRPHSSAAAFTGGTLAAGPVIGTALVVVNKLLGLDKLAYDVYKVTGSWDDPKVVLVSKREDADDEVDDDDDDT